MTVPPNRPAMTTNFNLTERVASERKTAALPLPVPVFPEFW